MISYDGLCCVGFLNLVGVVTGVRESVSHVKQQHNTSTVVMRVVRGNVKGTQWPRV
jgi:hypothetical protein